MAGAHMKLNPIEIEVTPKKSSHPGFVDHEYEPLEPGDVVALSDYYGVYTCVITRFTNRTVFMKRLYCPKHLDKGITYEYRCICTTPSPCGNGNVVPKILKIQEEN